MVWLVFKYIMWRLYNGGCVVGVVGVYIYVWGGVDINYVGVYIMLVGVWIYYVGGVDINNVGVLVLSLVSYVEAVFCWCVYLFYVWCFGCFVVGAVMLFWWEALRLIWMLFMFDVGRR